MQKRDTDATTGNKLLRLFQRLMIDGRKHFQADLADALRCSKQTIMRLIAEIEGVIGANLETGVERHRRWYQIKSTSPHRLGMNFEEIRYLAICRDLAAHYLPEQIKARMDASLFTFSVLMADQAYSQNNALHNEHIRFFSKGRIDYTPHQEHIEHLLFAAEANRICHVQYKAAGSTQRKKHIFAPQRIVGMNNALYVLGAGVSADYKRKRHLTNLAIHRIQHVTVTGKQCNFVIPEADGETFGLPWHEPRTIRIRFTPGRASEYVRERIWADQQSLEEQSDGGVILEIVTRSEP